MTDEIRLIPLGGLRMELERLKTDGCNVLVDLTAVDYQLYGGQAQKPVESPAPEGARFKLTYRLM